MRLKHASEHMQSAFSALLSNFNLPLSPNFYNSGSGSLPPPPRCYSCTKSRCLFQRYLLSTEKEAAFLSSLVLNVQLHICGRGPTPPTLHSSSNQTSAAALHDFSPSLSDMGNPGRICYFFAGLSGRLSLQLQHWASPTMWRIITKQKEKFKKGLKHNWCSYYFVMLVLLLVWPEAFLVHGYCISKHTRSKTTAASLTSGQWRMRQRTGIWKSWLLEAAQNKCKTWEGSMS